MDQESNPPPGEGEPTPPPPTYTPPPPPGASAPPPPPAYAPPPPPPPQYPLPPQNQYGGYAPAPGLGSGMSMQPAGFWIRVAAYIIDSVILSVVSFVIGFVLGLGAGISGGGNASSTATSTISAVAQGIAGLITIGYFIYLWSTGQTLGMRILNLRVIDASTGGQLSLGKAALRYLGLLISFLVCFIGVIWVAFDGRKQGWHDKIAGTMVVHA